MLKQKQKIDGLLGELVHYALQAGPRKVVITIEDLADQVRIEVQDDGRQRSKEERRRAEHLLNAPYRNELKEYYTGLAGEETCVACGLRIVRMMVDGGKIEQGDWGTRVTVWWKPE